MKNNFRSIIISLSVVIAAWILGSAWKSSHSSNHTISVTGLASKDFDSDLIVWSGSVIRKSLELKDAYAEIKKDQETIKKYLIAKGILESEMVFNSINISKDFNVIYNNDGSRRETFNGFVLSQQVEINSKNVEKVEKISREVTEIIDQGIEFNSNVPSYYYTKLDKLKLEMLANATANAKQRAEKIAENAGAELGKLKKADMGIFQITAQNSPEELTWGGAFNTYSKNKTARITVKTDYFVN
ncbi:MAG: SIMPL domain-containing protein [Bacteroidota bacterium]|jgi:hypothetical protein